MASRELPPSNPISEIPDLDIGLPSKRPAGGAQRNEVSVRPIAAQSSEYGIEGILDDDLLGSDFDPASLDIDVSDAARHISVASLAGSAWPHGTTPEPGSLEIGPAQLEPLCSWGERPTQWWQTIGYAFLVGQGRRQLKGQLGPISRELSQAQALRDECLARLAVALKDSLKREGSLNSALEAAETALTQQHQFAEQQRCAEANLSSETLALDQARAMAEAEIDELNKQASNLRDQMEDAKISLRREQARHQRLGIEQRNIEQASPPGSPPAARIVELVQQAEALGPQIKLAQDKVNSARTALEETTTAIEERTSQVRELEHRKDLLIRSLSSQLRQVSAAADGAIERQRKAWADLGRAILAARGRIAVNDATLREVARHDEAVATVWRREQVYTLALDNFDKAAVKRGIGLALAFLAVIVITMAWRLFR